MRRNIVATAATHLIADQIIAISVSTPDTCNGGGGAQRVKRRLLHIDLLVPRKTPAYCTQDSISLPISLRYTYQILNVKFYNGHLARIFINTPKETLREFEYLMHDILWGRYK